MLATTLGSLLLWLVLAALVVWLGGWLLVGCLPGPPAGVRLRAVPRPLRAVLAGVGARLAALALAVLMAAVFAQGWRAVAGDVLPGAIVLAALGPAVLAAFVVLRRLHHA